MATLPWSGVAQGLPTTTLLSDTAASRSSRVRWKWSQQQRSKHTLALLIAKTPRSKAQNPNSDLACCHQFTGITGQLLESNWVLASKMLKVPLVPWILSFKGASSIAPQISKTKCQSRVSVTWLMFTVKVLSSQGRIPGKCIKEVAKSSCSLPRWTTSLLLHSIRYRVIKESKDLKMQMWLSQLLLLK